jgi:hypothetical protein
MQFNFELPEAEASRLLAVGVARGMGLSPDTVSKAMVSRALVLERLNQLAPVGDPPAALSEFMAKVQAAHAASPRIVARLEAALRRELRNKKAAA